MVLENKQSLIVDYAHFRNANNIMAGWLAFHPAKFIPEINAALFAVVCRMYPNYQQAQECFVRIHRLPTADKIRELSYSHLSQLIQSTLMVI